jgi:tRNA (adenine22-N1)-methyltransferase
MPELSARLAAVARHVLPGEPLADIGTDHAYLPCFLVAAGAVPRVVASDRAPGPLAAAAATVRAEGLGDRIDLRLGDGLSVLELGEAATVVIAGMGGSLIATLLEQAPPQVLAAVRRLVLQPMGGEERLRLWLVGHGWRIAGEEMLADDGRLYVVITAEPGEQRLSPAEAVAGPFLLGRGGPLLASYIRERERQAARALAGARRSTRPEAKERAAALQQRLDLLRRILGGIQRRVSDE